MPLDISRRASSAAPNLRLPFERPSRPAISPRERCRFSFPRRAEGVRTRLPIWRPIFAQASRLIQLSGTTVAFDGTRFAYYDKTQSHLSYSGSDTRNNPTFLPNPVFLMLDFLDRSSQDGCGNCRLRLADLHDENRWQEAKSSFQVGPGGTVDTFRQTPAGDQVHHRVKVSPGGRPLITRIERQDEKSRGAAVIEFDAHDSEGLPRTITVTVKSEAGTLRAAFVIETIEPATAADDSVFRVDSAGVKTVWDVDSETFLRMRGASRPVSMAEIVERCLARRSKAGTSVAAK